MLNPRRKQSRHATWGDSRGREQKRTPPSDARAATSRRSLRKTNIGAYLAAHRWALLGTMQQFRRMPYTAMLTTVALAIALAFPAVLLVLLNNIQTVTANWDGAARISLFLKPDTNEAQALKLAEQLRGQAEIARVDYVSKARALEEFQRDSGLGDALALLGDNPLPAVLVVHPKNARGSPDAIQRLAQSLQSQPAVELAQWDMQWLQRLHGFIAVGERGVLVIGALLVIAALVVVGNTIRLAVQNRAQEIKVTKLIGASDAFVRRPFLYSGLSYGLAGSLLAWGLVDGVLWALESPVRDVAASYGSAFSLHGLGVTGTMGLLLFGIMLGFIGSWLSVSHHLRAIEPG
jgi:cell division transport system permease protein